ncbi:helix-turn-helix transcriptional regulator [Singulisphaera sp. Ch08]|uniref:Helix-turn-helix transcriptional regulator n=1 Tax=Singulisphaera sp. Ch08 TaxID=3120278 RepID=A0AAU7CI65_9BACT
MPSRAKSKGLQALIDGYIGGDPERAASFDRTCADLEIGVELNRLRTEAGLSTRALAQKVGTQASVISRIEQADYDGHSLSMLRRVAAALGQRVEVRFLPIGEAATKPKRASDGSASSTRPAKASPREESSRSSGRTSSQG